jgi:signal transduction histidine kinase/CheY-like chemotaxis protein
LTDKSLYTENSPTYQLCLYPTDELYEVYNTGNAVVATIGAVCIMLFTSLAFFLYDFFVRREFNAKKELLDAKRQFMRFVSHEVRTPLNSVVMGLTILKTELAASLGCDPSNFADIELEEVTRLNNNPNSRDWFLLAGEVEINAQGAVDVLNDLLNYDKIEQGTLNLEFALVSIWDLIQHTVEEFKLPAAKKKLNYGVTYVADKTEVQNARSLSDAVRKLKVLGDSVRVSQILRNLISNALKFTSKEGGLQVKVFLEQEEGVEETIVLEKKEPIKAQRYGHLHVGVKDTGAGMSADQLARLFRDGVQFNVNELQAGQGSGLGLYITKGIVEQHNGTLIAESEGLGLGTTFTMTLPLWRLPEKKKESTHESQTFDIPHSDVEMASLRVLVVDDVKTNRKLLCRLLRNGGHVCDEADNGQEAIDMVAAATRNKNPYDSVLMDYEMPIMNGPEAAKEIRAVGSDVYIVGITGNVLPDDISHFTRCGANAVLPKPLRIADLDCLWMEYGVRTAKNNGPIPSETESQSSPF